MRIEKDKYYYTRYYLYRCDLEKFSTEHLIVILRCLRAQISRISSSYPESGKEELKKKLEGQWVEYTWSNCDKHYTMVWMVKDVLSRREHVVKSKKEKKKLRKERKKRGYR